MNPNPDPHPHPHQAFRLRAGRPRQIPHRADLCRALGHLHHPMLALPHARYVDLLGRARPHLAIQYGRHYPSPWGDNYVTLRALLARAPSRTLLPLGYNTLNPYFFIYFSSTSHLLLMMMDLMMMNVHLLLIVHPMRIYIASTSHPHLLLMYFSSTSWVTSHPTFSTSLFNTRTCSDQR